MSSNGDREQITQSTNHLPDPSYWHDRTRLEDGTAIGRLGAYWYILDTDGSACSDGYHTIRVTESGMYEGIRGRRVERISTSR